MKQNKAGKERFGRAVVMEVAKLEIGARRVSQVGI